mmetsp:Transcript_298/g.1052  ORF Transcript_298/g.1052 Transcript_298/m.1052 type:complete len:309 (+) Transcript_298:1250-2176(+)
MDHPGRESQGSASKAARNPSGGRRLRLDGVRSILFGLLRRGVHCWALLGLCAGVLGFLANCDHAPDVQSLLRSAALGAGHGDIDRCRRSTLALLGRVLGHVRVLRRDGRRAVRQRGGRICDVGPGHSDVFPLVTRGLRFREDGGHGSRLRLLFLLHLHVHDCSRDVVHVDRYHHGRLHGRQEKLKEQRVARCRHLEHLQKNLPRQEERASVHEKYPCGLEQGRRRADQSEHVPGSRQPVLCGRHERKAGQEDLYGGRQGVCEQVHSGRAARSCLQVHQHHFGRTRPVLLHSGRGLLFAVIETGFARAG